jgi:hypothetical protein
VHIAAQNVDVGVHGVIAIEPRKRICVEKTLPLHSQMAAMDIVR